MDISNTQLAANLFHMVMDSFSPEELWEYLEKTHDNFLQKKVGCPDTSYTNISDAPAEKLFQAIADDLTPGSLWTYLKKKHAGFLQRNPFDAIPQEGKLAKEFLFKRPEVFLQINNSGPNYNKFSSQKELSNMLTQSDGEILIIRIRDINIKQTILLNKVTYKDKSGNFNRLHQIKKGVEDLYQRLDES